MERCDLLERFRETCLKHPHHKHWAQLFTVEAPKTPNWRWGLIKNALGYLLEREIPLTKCFTVARLSTDDAEDDRLREEFKFSDVQRAIQSPVWWARCHTLALLHSISGYLLSWCESCPCHDWLRSRLTKVEAEELHTIHKAFARNAHVRLRASQALEDAHSRNQSIRHT